MRQKDDKKFAELLNRIRKCIHTDEDIQVLLSRAITKESANYPLSTLHVFALNAQVDAHNLKMLESLNLTIKSLIAIDTKPKSMNANGPKDTKFAGGLPSELQIAIGARIMNLILVILLF